MIAGGVFAARRPGLLRVGRHDLIRWDDERGARLTPLADESPGAAGLAGLFFHISRCGSTLLAHLLGTSPGTCVLHEPAVVNLALGPGDRTAAERVTLLRRLVATCRAEHAPTAGSAVLKCSSWNILHADVLTTAFPDAPVVLVVRDPLEVLVSLLERPAGWMSQWDRIDREERAATAVASYLDAARGAVDQHWMLVRYEDLPGASAAVARHLGLGAIDDADAAAIAAVDIKHTDRRWRDDGAAKRARASHALHAAHARHTLPAYDELLATFAGRTARGAVTAEP